MSESKLPDGMYQNGRPIDPVFLDDECLYIRISEVDNHNRPIPTSIRYTEQSSNREKYSKPEWVLLPDKKNWGIISIKVKDIRTNFESTGGKDYRCDVIHDPNEDNYSHSVTRTCRADESIPNPRRKIKSSIKLQIRTRIIESCEVLKLPKKDVL